MKKFTIGRIFCFLMIVFLAGCNAKDYSKEDLTVTVPHVIFFGNCTEVIVDPGQGKCRIVHEHFNRKCGHAFKTPYSIATVYLENRILIISDKNVVNLEIMIDGKKYSLRKSNPVIHAHHGILWTVTNFKQGPDPRSLPGTPWVFPLSGNIPATR